MRLSDIYVSVFGAVYYKSPRASRSCMVADDYKLWSMGSFEELRRWFESMLSCSFQRYESHVVSVIMTIEDSNVLSRVQEIINSRTISEYVAIYGSELEIRGNMSNHIIPVLKLLETVK